MPVVEILKIEMTNEGVPTTPLPGIDLVLHINPDYIVDVPGQIRAYSTDNHAEDMAAVLTSPTDLAPNIRTTLRQGVRAIIGNAGVELTFRHIVSDPIDNVRWILRWAEEAYDLVGPNLVLAPMDYDLLQDGMLGCHLMDWAAKRSVPLAIFCGYRFFFQTSEFSHIAAVHRRHPMKSCWHPYRYPFSELYHWIRHTGVELWTGAGSYEGLAAGAIERAARFGFKGIFTNQLGWKPYVAGFQPQLSPPPTRCLSSANIAPYSQRFQPNRIRSRP